MPMGADLRTGHGTRDCAHCDYLGKYIARKDMYECPKQYPRDTRPEWVCAYFVEKK